MASAQRTQPTLPLADKEATAPSVIGIQSASWGQALGLGAVAVVAFACMLNGRSAAAMALLAVFTGLGLIIAPPRWKIPVPLLVAAGLVLLAGSVTLLPAGWLNSHPSWRSALADTWGVVFPPTITPQPDHTYGAWLTTFIGCGWFFLLIGNPTSASGRRLVLRAVTLSMMLISAIAVASKFQVLSLNWPLDYPARENDLGPFPNRNHFAGFCAIGAVLSAALAYDAFRKASAFWLLFAGGFLLFSTGIILNTSRAGIGLLFIGLPLWLATASMRKDILKRTAVAASLILAAIAILAFQKAGVGARIFDTQTAALSEAGSFGGRSSIHIETAKHFSAAPLTGVGLGQFDPVFAVMHQLPGHNVRFTHPESDWLWWSFEAGLLPALAVALAVGWLIRYHRHRHHHRTTGHRNPKDLRLRLAALIGLLLALLHSIVDVPLHNAGIAFLTLFLAAQTVAPKSLTSLASPLYRHAFRLVGVAVLYLGYLLTLTAMGDPLYPGRMRLDAERKLIQTLVENARYGEALDRVSSQIQRSPLHWDLYYQSASLHLALRHPSETALADFNRARALEPRSLDLCFAEGKLWLRYEPALAIIPWRELFNRSAARSHYYSMMLGEAHAHPDLLQELRRLAQTSSMKLTALAHTPAGEEWQASLSQLLRTDPDLDQLEAAERSQLFHLWQSQGDRSQLVTTLENKPEWQPYAWQVLADEYAQASLFEKAWTVQAQFGFSEAPRASQSILKDDIPRLERYHLLHPNDLRSGVELFYALNAAKRQMEAQRLLEKLIALPDSPPYLRQELALIHAQNRDFRRAYETLKEALTNRS